MIGTATSTVTLTRTKTPTVTLTATSTQKPENTTWTGGIKAYPNPAKDRMTFVMNVEEASDVVVSVYNLSGERVAVLKQACGAGAAFMVWNFGNNVAAGIYVARITIGGSEKAKLKVAVLKK